MDLLFGKSVDLTEDIKNGATVIDVRTRSEYQGGHVKGSINIPLNEITANENKLKNYKKIIFCCASGNRSGRATSIMQQKGLDCINGGSWLTVNSYT